MKTIAQIIAEVRRAGYSVSTRESTWAESKWWLTRKAGRPSSRDVEIIKRILARGGRRGQVELNWWDSDKADLDQFAMVAGIFLSFPKSDKAAQLIEAGVDPTDLQNA